MKFPLPTPERPPNRVYPPGTPTMHGLTSVITAGVVVSGLYFAREVLIPITLAVLLSFLLAPLVSLLRRLHFGQLPSIFVAVIAALVSLLAVSTLIGAQIAQLASALPQYQEAIEAKIETVQEKTVGRADSMLQKAAGALQRVTPERPPDRQPRGRSSKPSATNPMPVEVHEPAPTPLQVAQRVFTPVVGPLETTFIVLVVTIFILLQREDLRDRLIRLFGSRDLHRTTTAINDAASRLSRYFVAQLGVNVGTGATISIGLAIIGVPGALLFGVLTALLRFVPYIGLWIAALTATFLAAAIQPQWTMAVWTLVMFAVVDIVAGQVVEPLLYGHSSGLSPLAVVVAAIFWSWLWGPIGLVLSTPLTLCVVTLGRYAERLRFLTVLLGDQPALTPAQNFYQRLLADDPHEAIVQAERLLRDMSLLDYYDDVAREGLRLARNDALRGVFSIEQLARMNEALLDIVENLETVEGAPDHRPHPEFSPTPEPEEKDDASDHRLVVEPSAPPPERAQILIIAGRGAFDAPTAAIAGQLLSRRGFKPLVANYEDLRAGTVDTTAFKNSTLVCIITLDAAESPPYLRNLLRRIQERSPGTTMVVGIGGQTERVADAAIIASARTATAYRDVVEQCLFAANAAPPVKAESTGGGDEVDASDASDEADHSPAKQPAAARSG